MGEMTEKMRMVSVEIVEMDSKDVVKRMGPMSLWEAEKVRDGVEINLNHIDYMVRIVDRDG